MERKVKRGQTSFSHQEVPNPNKEKQIASLERNTEIVLVRQKKKCSGLFLDQLEEKCRRNTNVD